MSYPVFWPKSAFFYPIGNTAPVYLTQPLAPEERASVLLVGCGDPRSILYTIHAGEQILTSSRQLDFTCCDYEPAVLARNVLLFSLIVDNRPNDLTWNIFYHFKLDDKSLDLLVSQCERLTEMSVSLGAWLISPYARFVRVCNLHTLAQLHRHWELYARAKTFSKSKNDALWSAFASVFKQWHGEDDSIVLNFSAARSGGPFWTDVAQALGNHFQHFWKTGTLFTDPDVVASTTKVNPIFVYSVTGEGCAVHYGTYPLHGFHLAIPLCMSRSKALQADDFVSCAKEQFQQWGDSFRAAVSPNSQDIITIRLFVGDALALCRTLHHSRITSSTSASLYAYAWTGTELVLDGGDYGTEAASAAPTTFNIIDTSNVIDHVGLLNVLVAAAPILHYGPSSTLYTEALVVKGKSAETGLIERLCAEIPAVALLLGLTPAAWVSNFNTCSNTHELFMFYISDSSQYHERVAWKIPYLCDPSPLKANTPHPSFDPLHLAKLLFDIYYHMFQDEDMKRKIQTLTIGDSIIHYHRATFAALLAGIKSRVDTDWNMVMNRFHDMLVADSRLLMNSNNYQELCCQLHIRGVYSVDTMKPGFSKLVNIDRTSGIFKGWGTIPPVVCLVLVVPRMKLHVLENKKREDVGSPILQIEVIGQTFHNVFSSVQMAFGRVSLQGSGSDARVILTEDTAGFSGSSPLVVSVWMSSFNLVYETQKPPKVSLSICSTPASVKAFLNELGMTLALFTADLLDSKYVHVVAARPGREGELARLRASAPHSPQGELNKVYVSLDNASVTSLAAKWDVSHLLEHDTSAEVTFKQVSLCSLQVQWGKHEKTLVYPCVIDGRQTKLRIARKSGWVEAIVPVHRPLDGSDLTFMKLVPIKTPEGPPILWNVHHANLERLPIISATSRVKVSGTISPHLGLSLSDRERRLHERTESSSASHDDVMVHVKETISALFLRATEKDARRIFSFADPSCGGTYTVLFLNEIRLDLPAHTFIADVCILPLTTERVNNLISILGPLTENGQMVIINTLGREVTAWKHLLPAFVERCRTWSHKATCEYLRAGTIPLTVEFAKNPICSCGEGVSLGALTKVPGWNKFAPYMTRAAISPLFAVSYIESVGSAAKAISQGMKANIAEATKVCAQCGKSERLFDCSRCKRVRYCGAACQKADWKQHKSACNLAKAK